MLLLVIHYNEGQNFSSIILSQFVDLLYGVDGSSRLQISSCHHTKMLFVCL